MNMHVSTLKTRVKLVSLACLCTLSMNAMASMSAADVERLGKDLTPTGAEKAGNGSTIPAWTGGITKAPAGFDANKGYLNPFAAEKPLYTITADNMAQYKDLLAPGQMEMLKRFPTYKMIVYPSHRTAAYPQSAYDSIKQEAAKATLSEGGNGVQNVKYSSVPFPVPKEGVEVIWNHIMRYRGGSIERSGAEFPVQTNGAFTPVTSDLSVAFASSMENPEPNRLLYFLASITGPSSVAGESLLVVDPLDQVKEARLAWIYNPGQRRVLRAPDIGYDSPGLGADGLRTTDDFDSYNGSPDRYNWKLVGKKEMIISYNNFKMTDKSMKYKDFIKPGHMEQAFSRYEAHRVWVVEATLKEGKRHIYAKRTFYVDEDSWAVAHTDAYDGRGDLWRVHETHAIQYYDAPTPGTAAEVIYDLQARRYTANGLGNEDVPIKFGTKFKPSYFTPGNLRRLSN